MCKVKCINRNYVKEGEMPGCGIVHSWPTEKFHVSAFLCYNTCELTEAAIFLGSAFSAGNANSKTYIMQD